MAGLLDCLEDAINGQGRVALLVGEPGIGKTRTANELAVRARARTIPVLIGRCEEGDGVPSLWPWTQIIRAYLSRVSPQQLHADLGKGVTDIARAFPEVQELLPNLALPPTTNSESSRFRFLTAFPRSSRMRHDASRW
jgi:predicted ATPase